jgi:O-acetyl-ADP-ribose deacetylase (regulator of RNase III)
MVRSIALPDPSCWPSAADWAAVPRARLAKHVVHTVGPIYRDGSHGERQLLERAYRSSIELALQHGARSIAFPAISCGAYGYPHAEAAEVALTVSMAALRAHAQLEEIRFVLFGDAIHAVFSARKTELDERMRSPT